MKKIIATLIMILSLAGCITTPPMIVDVYRDGDDLVFRKSNVRVNTVTYEAEETNGRDIRVNIK